MNKAINEKIKLAKISSILLIIFSSIIILSNLFNLDMLFNHEKFFEYFDNTFGELLNVLLQSIEIDLDIYQIRSIAYIYSCVVLSITFIFQVLIILFAIIVLKSSKLELNKFVKKKKYLITLAIFSFLNCLITNLNILSYRFAFSNLIYIVSGILLLVSALSNKEAEKVSINREKYGNDPFAKDTQGHSLYEENIIQQQQNIVQDSVTVKSEKELNDLFLEIAELERRYKNDEISLESYQIQKEILLEKLKK